MMQKNMLIFGTGYVAHYMARALHALGWMVYCSSRRALSTHQTEYCTTVCFSDVHDVLQSVSCVLNTVPPNDSELDPVFTHYGKQLAQNSFQWIGYLSSTSVYGNHHGLWVNEDTDCKPNCAPARLRLLVETQWLNLYQQYDAPVHIFRLSGIYGPFRNALERIRNGKNHTIIKKDHYFSRIHVADICQALLASIHAPEYGVIYNLADDEPAPLQEVEQFAARLLNQKKLKEIPFENAVLSDRMIHFFQDNKKVSNLKIVQHFNMIWHYPNYRLGLLNEHHCSCPPQ